MPDEKLFAGGRVRELRQRHAMTQAGLARDLGISPSYLNQIEHDRRPLTPSVLHRIVELLAVSPDALLADGRARLVAELEDAATDALEGDPLGPGELRDLVARAPRVARALVVLHRKHRAAVEQAAVLAGDGRSTPYEEVRDFFFDRDNYVDQLDRAGERLADDEGVEPGRARSLLAGRLSRRHGVEVREDERGAPGGMMRTFDAEARVLHLAPELRPAQQAFQMATQLAYLEHRGLLDDLVARGRFGGGEALALARIGLANYFAGAVLMPYKRFRSAADEARHDVEQLSSHFDAGFESVCHRLSTLQRPEARGVPFAFVRVDRAGNMSKRQTASSFHLSRIGGTCPLWVVFEAFSEPGRVFRQVAEMPDGRRYLWIARAVRSGQGGFGRPGKTFAVGLGCELQHARRLVYGDGLDLTDRGSAMPIGPGCKVCDRPSCPQRAFPAIGRPLLVDEATASFAPYAAVIPP